MKSIFLMAYGLISSITAMKFAFNLWDLGDKKYLYISQLTVAAMTCGLVWAITKYVHAAI